MSKAEKLAQQILDYSTVVARAARGQTEPPPGWSGDIKADIARLLEPHLVGEWRDIESAPKDGSVILGFWNPVKGGDLAPCYAVTRFVSGNWMSDDENEDDIYAEPSYWMPLPAPPKGEQSA